MSDPSLLVAAFALTGLLFLLLAAARLRRRRLLAAGGHGLAGGCLLALGAVSGAVALNLHTYQRLTHEQEAAVLEFHELGTQHFEARLRLAGGTASRRFELRGDEWQLDARLLKWQGWANLLGLDSRYRLERLGGRYADVEQERARPRSVYPLARSPGLDLWQVARRYQGWLPWVDASYGSAAYLPMADGARFEVRVSQSGLVARPLNPEGERAVQGWR